MPSPRAERCRRAVRWLGPAALLALAPKCLLCVFAYAGLGAALGLGGPEMCGAPEDASASWATWTTLLAWIGLAVGGVGVIGIFGVSPTTRLIGADEPRVWWNALSFGITRFIACAPAMAGSRQD